MNKEQMDKYAYELMVKNNPDEAVKNLLLKDKQITNLQENYERIYNENCKLREKQNITDNVLLEILEERMRDER